MKIMIPERAKTYLIPIAIGLALFAVLNYYSFLRMDPTTCDDCFITFGFPLSIWEEGGYVGVRRIVWTGLIGNVWLAISAGLLMGWIYQRFRRENNPS